MNGHFHARNSLTAAVLVRTVRAVLFAVAEKSPFDAITIAASEEPVLAQRFVGVQQWLHFPLLVLQFAVLNGVLPVAGLLLDVEVQTSWATDGLEALEQSKTTKNQQTSPTILYSKSYNSTITNFKTIKTSQSYRKLLLL